MIVVPFMLMWAVTVRARVRLRGEGWYAVTPGSHKEGVETLEEVRRARLTLDEAVASATELYPDLRGSTSTCLAEDVPTAAYTMYLEDGYDLWGDIPGEVGTFVDRHRRGQGRYGYLDESKSQVIWEDFNYPADSGYIVNGCGAIWLSSASPRLSRLDRRVHLAAPPHRQEGAQKSSRQASAEPPPMPGGLAEELAVDPEMTRTRGRGRRGGALERWRLAGIPCRPASTDLLDARVSSTGWTSSRSAGVPSRDPPHMDARRLAYSCETRTRSSRAARSFACDGNDNDIDRRVRRREWAPSIPGVYVVHNAHSRHVSGSRRRSSTVGPRRSPGSPRRRHGLRLGREPSTQLDDVVHIAIAAIRA